MTPHHVSYHITGATYTRRAKRFIDRARKGSYPNAVWLSEVEGMSYPMAQRMVRSLKADLGAPLIYSHDYHGYELSDPDWKYGL